MIFVIASLSFGCLAMHAHVRDPSNQFLIADFGCIYIYSSGVKSIQLHVLQSDHSIMHANY